MNKTIKLLAYLLIFCFIFILSVNTVFAANTAPINSNESLLTTKTDKLSFQTKTNYAIFNGNKIKLDTSALNTNKQMLVPAKFLAEALGGKYAWNASSKTMTITKDKTTIIFKINSKFATIHGLKIPLDVAPSLIKGVPLVPVKFLAEKMGAQANWQVKTKTFAVTATTKIINFPDKNLEASIRKQILKPVGNISLSDIDKIDSLFILQSDVTDLNGLQFMTGLTFLQISNTPVRDISPIRNLTNLKYLYLSYNLIFDISPLQNLINLEELDLSNNQISTMSVLSKLTKLKKITLWDSDSLSQMALLEQKAKSIVNEVIQPDMTDLEKELALHDYLVTHVKYDQENYDKRDIPKESHDFLGALINQVGVCDAYAEAMQLLLNTCGIECIVVIGDTFLPKDPGYEAFGHAWNIVKIDGNYYHLDPTFNDPTNEEKKNILEHTYFNLSDKQMAADHKWNRSIYPSCTVDNDNFANTMLERRDTLLTDSWNYKIFNNNLYKIKPDGTSSEKLSTDSLSDISLSGDWIFYLNTDDQKMYRIRTNGSEKTLITDAQAALPSVNGDWLYYIDRSTNPNYKNLYKIQFDGNNRTQISGNEICNYFSMYEDWIYLKSFDWNIGTKLYRFKTDSANRMTVINDSVAGFTRTETSSGSTVEYYFSNYDKILNDWIFYINQGEGNKLYRINNDATNRTKLNDDNCSGLEVCGDWIYYINTADNKYYRIKADGSQRQLVG